MLALDRKKEGRFFLVLLLLMIFLGLLTYRFYDSSPVLDSLPEDLLMQGQDLKNMLSFMGQGIADWSHSMAFSREELVLKKKEGLFPSQWILELPLNLSPQELTAVKDSIQGLFPKGFFFQESESFWEAGLFFLTTHRIVLRRPTLRARLAIVIDDLGEASARLDAFHPISGHLTMSVLPRLPNSMKDVQGVVQMKQELLLHQPMEPLASDLDPGPGAIYGWMGKEEVEGILQENISFFPPALVGMNNHMGSLITQDDEIIAWVLDYLQEQGLFFLDSSTAAESVVPALARQRGMPTLTNHLFLDNVDEYQYIKEMLQRAGWMALERGYLIAIGHARVNTAWAIQASIPFFEAQGIQLVHLSSLIP